MVSVAAKVEKMHKLSIMFETVYQSIAQIMPVLNSPSNKDLRHYIEDTGLYDQ